jgi:hypothetical protein
LRVKIRRDVADILHGLRLGPFVENAIYDLERSVASLLIVEGAAEPVDGVFGRSEASDTQRLRRPPNSDRRRKK